MCIFLKLVSLFKILVIQLQTSFLSSHNYFLWRFEHYTTDLALRYSTTCVYAAVNRHLELPLLKDRQRFDAVSTSNLEVYKFRDWWILTYFIFGHGESSLNNIWSMVNLERTCILLFYYFLCLKANLDLEKTNQLGESSPNFIFAVVNLDPIILEKRWIDGESWPNDFVDKVNRGEDLRWVGSRFPLTHALIAQLSTNRKHIVSYMGLDHKVISVRRREWTHVIYKTTVMLLH